MVSFTFSDCATRCALWDDSAAALEPMAPPSRSSPGQQLPDDVVRRAAHAQSSFMYARTRFPPPMSQREYLYARRVWYKADDGGCYCISKACQHPMPPQASCRTSRVTDFASGFVIRQVRHSFSALSHPHVGVTQQRARIAFNQTPAFGACV